ncbi:MAG: SufD family Fe-S cluster assembly protein [Patescibacteria group bacterium]
MNTTIDTAELRIPAGTTRDLIHLFAGDSIDLENNHRVIVEEDARLNMWQIVFCPGKKKCTTEIVLAGRGASVEHRTIFFQTGDDHSSIFVTAVNDAPETTAHLISKGIVQDRAYTRYNGLIRMTERAGGSEGTLHQNALMLSDTSKIEAIPGLEIETNDVRAGHSAAMTRVDADQLFYAASRGIGKEEAIRMIAEGFLKPLIDTIPNEETREALIAYIESALVTTPS